MALLACDVTGRITLARGSGLRRLSAGELVGENVREWARRAPWLATGVERALAGEPSQMEGDLDEGRWVGLCAPLHGSSGGNAGAVVALTDVRELRSAEERFDLIFEASPVPIIISTAAEGRVLDMNQSAEEATGWRRDELIGRTAREVDAYWDKAEAKRVFAMLLATQGNVRQMEVRFRRKDGSLYLGLTSFVTLELDGQMCVVSMAWDITEHRRMEDQLRQSAKMEAVGQLAGGVAHDFNNILTVILGSTELLLHDKTLSTRQRALLEQIGRSSQRAAGLTRQLLAFSRKQVLKLVVLDLNAVVREMMPMLEPLVGEDIVLRLELAPNVVLVRADRTQLEQVLLNLAVNARDAMPGGGMVTVRTATIEAEELREEPPSGAESYVMLEVRDTGIGMSPDVQARIFEPFFTTKPQGEGTGLGLSTVYGIVRQSGGTIQVESAPGQGATFRVILPRAEAEVRREPTLTTRPVTRARPAKAKETILVVEDEVDVREFVAQTLAAQGYRVLVARDGEEADALARERGGPIDLLLTDVVMPRMPGPEVARRLRSDRPAMRVLFMSGHTGQAPEGADWPTPSTFLSKPFSVAHLLHEVQTALSARGP